MIRRATDNDLLEILKMEARTNPYPWTDKMLLSSFKEHDFFVLDTPDFEGIQGYLISQSVCNEANLLHVLISKDSQSKGYGRFLLGEWLDQLQGDVDTVWLEVRESNVAAQKLYESCSFQNISKRKNYYKTRQGLPKETALIYKLDC